jgi:hypothetical protein
LQRLIAATERAEWRRALAPFGPIDCTYLPEYHLAYATRMVGGQPLLWEFSQGADRLAYPFLLTPVEGAGSATACFDISSVYGFTGPLSTSRNPAFLHQAWQAFDGFAAQQRVIAEFIRFSPFNRNEGLAHPQVEVSLNRELAVSRLPAAAAELSRLLGPKTRNMLRKAERAGLIARELELPQHLPAFRALYQQTMDRNAAPPFFRYDDAYWTELLRLEPGALRLFAACSGDRMVAACMSVSFGASGLYHLGASLEAYARSGAGNLCLFAMSRALMDSGVAFLNMTGGRTPKPGDPLLLFKRSNATGTAPFHIGKRVLDAAAYNALAAAWQARHGQPPSPEKLIFWRS